jgi:uncharacterized protein YjbJ (UPF0337 family)
LVGAIKEAAGKLVGDTKLQVDGKASNWPAGCRTQSAG